MNNEIAQFLGIDAESVSKIDEVVLSQIKLKIQEKNEMNKNKTKLLEILNQKDEQINELNLQIDKTSSSLFITNEKLKKYEQLFKESNNNESLQKISNDFQINKLNKQLQLSEQQIEYLNKQVKDLNTEFLNYKCKVSEDLVSLTSAKSGLQTTCKLNQTTIDSLKDNLNNKTMKLDEKTDELNELKKQYSLEKSNFVYEMDLKKKLIESLNNQLDTMNMIISDGDSGDNSSPVSSRGHQTVSIQQYNEMLNELHVCQKTIKEYESKILEYQEILKVHSLNDNDHNVLNSTEADLSLLKRELIKEKNSKIQLQKTLQQFMEELEHKIPMINEFKNKSQLLEDKLYKSSLLLEKYQADVETFRKVESTHKVKLTEYESTIKLLQQQRLDLANQVQFLLMVTSSSNKKLSLVSNDDIKFIRNIIKHSNNLENVNGKDIQQDNIQSTISRELVNFKNIKHLQENNENLILALRTLGSKLEEYESNNINNSTTSDFSEMIDNSDEANAIDEARQAIISLEKYNDSLLSKIECVTEERDIFKTLLQSHGLDVSESNNTSTSIFNKNNSRTFENKLAAQISQLEQKIETLEKVEDNYKQEIHQLQKDVSHVMKEKLSLEIDYHKELNSKKMIEEKYEQIVNNELSNLTMENKTMKTIIEEYSQTILEKDRIHNQTLNEMFPLFKKIETLNNEIDALQRKLHDLDLQYKLEIESKDKLLNSKLDAQDGEDIQNKNNDLLLKLNDTIKNHNQIQEAFKRKEYLLNEEITTLKNKLESVQAIADAAKKNEHEQTAAYSKELLDKIKHLEDHIQQLESNAADLLNENTDINHKFNLKTQELQLSKESVERWKLQVQNLNEKIVSVQTELNNNITMNEEKFAKLKHQAHQRLDDFKKQNAEIITKLNSEIQVLKANLQSSTFNSDMKSLEILKKELQEKLEAESQKKVEEIKETLASESNSKIESIIKKSKEEIKQQIEKRREALAKSFEKSVEERAKQITEAANMDFKKQIDEAKKKANDDAERRSAMKIKILENKLSKLKETASAASPVKNVTNNTENKNTENITAEDTVIKPAFNVTSNPFGVPKPMVPSQNLFGSASQANSFQQKIPQMPKFGERLNGNATNLFGKRPFASIETPTSNAFKSNMSQSSALFSGILNKELPTSAPEEDISKKQKTSPPAEEQQQTPPNTTVPVSSLLRPISDDHEEDQKPELSHGVESHVLPQGSSSTVQHEHSVVDSQTNPQETSVLEQKSSGLTHQSDASNLEQNAVKAQEVVGTREAAPVVSDPTNEPVQDVSSAPISESKVEPVFALTTDQNATLGTSTENDNVFQNTAPTFVENIQPVHEKIASKNKDVEEPAAEVLNDNDNVLKADIQMQEPDQGLEDTDMDEKELSNKDAALIETGAPVQEDSGENPDVEMETEELGGGMNIPMNEDHQLQPESTLQPETEIPTETTLHTEKLDSQAAPIIHNEPDLNKHDETDLPEENQTQPNIEPGFTLSHIEQAIEEHDGVHSQDISSPSHFDTPFLKELTPTKDFHPGEESLANTNNELELSILAAEEHKHHQENQAAANLESNLQEVYDYPEKQTLVEDKMSEQSQNVEGDSKQVSDVLYRNKDAQYDTEGNVSNMVEEVYKEQKSVINEQPHPQQPFVNEEAEEEQEQEEQEEQEGREQEEQQGREQEEQQGHEEEEQQGHEEEQTHIETLSANDGALETEEHFDKEGEFSNAEEQPSEGVQNQEPETEEVAEPDENTVQEELLVHEETPEVLELTESSASQTPAANYSVEDVSLPTEVTTTFDGLTSVSASPDMAASEPLSSMTPEEVVSTTEHVQNHNMAITSLVNNDQYDPQLVQEVTPLEETSVPQLGHETSENISMQINELTPENSNSVIDSSENNE